MNKVDRTRRRNWNKGRLRGIIGNLRQMESCESMYVTEKANIILAIRMLERCLKEWKKSAPEV